MLSARIRTLAKRSAIVVALLLALIATVFFTRWQIAHYRVSSVSAAAASPTATTAAVDSSARPNQSSLYKAPEAAGRVALHTHAIASYQLRRDTDLAALPPAGGPLTAEKLQILKKLSDAGNARAACVLAQEAMKCSFFPKIGEKETRWREAKLAALHRERKSDERLAEQVRHAREMLTELAAHCDGSAVVLDAVPAWQYGLRAALLGFEPSIASFVMMPMFDPTDWSASVDAFAAYRTYYGPMLEALAQRGHPFFTMQASAEYSGDLQVWEVFGQTIRMSEIERDPVRALGYAYVNAEVARRQAAMKPASDNDEEAAKRRAEDRQSRIASLEANASPQQKQWAREFADQLIANWGNDWKPIEAPTPQATDEKRSRFDDFDEACRRP